MSLQSVFHIGMTVSDLDEAVVFWEGMLGVEAQRTRVDYPELGQIVGYPDVTGDFAFVELPGGMVLELLDYNGEKPPAVEADETRAPGHLHFAIQVDDIDDVFRQAVAHGARGVSDRPVVVQTGDYSGAKVAYLRIPPDGQTIELVQPPSEP